MVQSRKRGFSFIELLISVMVISLLSSFTIPKLLHAKQQVEFNSVAKETMAMITEAYDQYKLQNPSGSYMRASDLLPQMNTVTQLPVGTQIDWYQGAGTYTCNTECYAMPNGAVIAFYGGYFCNDVHSATDVLMDPDGRVTDGTANGPGKGLMIFLQANGSIKTYGTLSPATPTASTASGSCDGWFNPTPTAEPSWFSWNT